MAVGIKKPMLAGKCEDPARLKFPTLATPKIDGIRCLIISENGWRKAVSRNFKPIPNNYIRNWLQENCPVGFDGELIVTNGTFQQTSSAVMSRDGEPNFSYLVFDWVHENPEDCYQERTWDIANYGPICSKISYVLPKLITGLEELEEFEQECLAQGFEGVMVRDPEGPYKFGRSTPREGWLLKIKRFEDHEAVVVGFTQRMHNANEATLDELGRTKRSSHKANKVPTGMLGTLVVRDLDTDVQFEVGTGFDDKTRVYLWETKLLHLGRVIKYKSQPTGVKDKPRFPVFLGFRTPEKEKFSV